MINIPYSTAKTPTRLAKWREQARLRMLGIPFEYQITSLDFDYSLWCLNNV